MPEEWRFIMHFMILTGNMIKDIAAEIITEDSFTVIS